MCISKYILTFEVLQRSNNLKSNVMTTLNLMTKARNLVGTEINDLEYIDHLVLENSKTYFQVIHLNGDKRLVEINEILN